jgi:hypothetical protein
MLLVLPWETGSAGRTSAFAFFDFLHLELGANSVVCDDFKLGAGFRLGDTTVRFLQRVTAISRNPQLNDIATIAAMIVSNNDLYKWDSKSPLPSGDEGQRRPSGPLTDTSFFQATPMAAWRAKSNRMQANHAS